MYVLYILFCFPLKKKKKSDLFEIFKWNLSTICYVIGLLDRRCYVWIRNLFSINCALKWNSQKYYPITMNGCIWFNNKSTIYEYKANQTDWKCYTKYCKNINQNSNIIFKSGQWALLVKQCIFFMLIQKLCPSINSIDCCHLMDKGQRGNVNYVKSTLKLRILAHTCEEAKKKKTLWKCGNAHSFRTSFIPVFFFQWIFVAFIWY